MKKLLIALILLTLSGSPLLYAQETPKSAEMIELEISISNVQSIAEKVVNNTVSIVALSDNGFGTCSGVLIKNTVTESIVLTAKHCIGTLKEMYVENILVASVGISLYDDLAYVKLGEKIPDKTPAIISEFVPKRGDIVVAVGYPTLGLHFAVGTMSIISLDWQFARINIISGCSGGGAYNEYGELVGIVWGSIGGNKEKDEDSKIGIFEKLQDVVAFVKKNKLLE